MDQELMLRIAKECFGINTLVPRLRDDLDFHEVSVWSIARALEQAYEAGKKTT